MKRKKIKKRPWYEKASFWRAITIILVLILLLVIFPKSDDEDVVVDYGKDIIEARVQAFLQKGLEPGTGMIIHSTYDVGPVYAVDVTIGNETATIYASKDGRFLFPGAMDMTQLVPMGSDVTTISDSADVIIGEDAVLGNPGAPVTIVEFSDYQCPMCAKFWEDTFQELKKKYIDTGKVKFVFKDFPLGYHQYAQKAAEASECAHEQGRFWDYNDLLFENSKRLSDSKLRELAQELALDMTRFNECLDSGKYLEETQEDMAEGIAAGVQGTPTFYINGVQMAGALPLSAFEEVIDGQLI